MLKHLAIVGFVAGALLVPSAQAQKATEIFIPLGESPGVSGVTSLIGTIESVDRDAGVMTVRSESGEHRVELTVETNIWLDKSRRTERNERGSPADCKKGRKCEVKFVYEDGTPTVRAEWIKIRPWDDAEAER